MVQNIAETMSATPQIVEVWDSNLEEEFRNIRQMVSKFNYVAMDTEFPGVVARPVGQFSTAGEYQYQMLRCNVDLLKLIQIGLTFFNESGESPQPACTWQFNFNFSLKSDMWAMDSIQLLKESGIAFDAFDQKGIVPDDFAELLTTSGLVLNENIRWISFHSGYDFGYLLKLLTADPLPNSETDFFKFLGLFFPRIYDVKYLMKSCKNLKGGLQEVADELEIVRVGPQHQAGSDSLMTGSVFFKMLDDYFENNLDDDKYCGHLFGLGAGYLGNGTAAASEPAVSELGSAVPYSGAGGGGGDESDSPPAPPSTAGAGAATSTASPSNEPSSAAAAVAAGDGASASNCATPPAANADSPPVSNAGASQ